MGQYDRAKLVTITESKTESQKYIPHGTESHHEAIGKNVVQGDIQSFHWEN